MRHKLSNVDLVLSPFSRDKILHHIYEKPTLECGGYLIGKIENHSEDKLIGNIDDVFYIEGSGTSSNFTFTSASGLQAYAYCKKNYSTDEFSKKLIIGNYHSHGDYQAFFSSIDEKMMKATTSREFYLVFSPSQHSFTAIYKDSDSQIYEVACEYDAPGFKYIFPQMDFYNDWPLVKTGVDYSLLSVQKATGEVQTDNSSLHNELKTSSSNNKKISGRKNMEDYGSFQVAQNTETTKANNEIFKQRNIQKANEYFLKAKEEYDNKNYHISITYLNKALEQNQKDLSFYLLRGKAYIKNYEYERAKKDLNKIISAQINSPKELPDAYYYLADIEYTKKNYPVSISHLNNAIKINMQAPEYYFLRGVVYYYCKQFEMAKYDFNFLLNNKGENQDMILKIYFYLGLIFKDEKKYDNAKEYFEKSLCSTETIIKNAAGKFIGIIDNEIRKREWR
jgi:tetratricopeptide (TPR) repeat protein